MFAQVTAAAAGDGVDLRFDDVVVANSRRAHRLLHAALTADPTGELEAFAEALATVWAEVHPEPEPLAFVAVDAGTTAQACGVDGCD